MPTSVTSLLATVLFLVIAIVGIACNMFEGIDWIIPLGAAIMTMVVCVVSFVKGD